MRWFHWLTSTWRRYAGWKPKQQQQQQLAQASVGCSSSPEPHILSVWRHPHIMVQHKVRILPLWLTIEATEEQQTHILNGSYCLVPDQGALARHLHTLPNVKETHSSHPSINNKSYSLSVNEAEPANTAMLLFGTVFRRYSIPSIGLVDGECTWFQMERYGLNLPMHHLLAYVQYEILNANVGPNGTSKFTDVNPLILV